MVRGSLSTKAFTLGRKRLDVKVMIDLKPQKYHVCEGLDGNDVIINRHFRVVTCNDCRVYVGLSRMAKGPSSV